MYTMGKALGEYMYVYVGSIVLTLAIPLPPWSACTRTSRQFPILRDSFGSPRKIKRKVLSQSGGILKGTAKPSYRSPKQMHGRISTMQ